MTDTLPPIANYLHHFRRIRLCEGDAAAQLVFEHALMAYAIAVRDAAVAAERDAIIDIIERWRVPVGNSCSGELAAEWTMEALRDLRDAIRARATAPT